MTLTLLAAVGLVALVPATPIAAAPPTGFQTTTVISSGLMMPTGFALAPDGRIFITERAGKVRVFKDGQLLATPFVDLPSITSGDRGMMGIAVDPDFNTNHYLYLYYTSAADLLNYLVRYDASDDVGTDRTVLFQTTAPSNWFHVGDSIRFGADGKLYFSVGDNGYGAQAQRLDNPHGKIHRINRDGTIPTDNPFYNTPGAVKSIWAYGLRNPFRFQFDPLTQDLYAGDVGSTGSFAKEEIDRVVKGGNYGWNAVEGYCPSDCPYIDPIYQYSHDVGTASITGGPLYRGAMFPQEYVGSLFFADYVRGWMKRLVFDTDGKVKDILDFDLNAGSVVEILVADDGSMYYVTYWPGRLYRVTYTAPSSSMPSPWLHGDIGSPALAGSATYGGGAFTVKGAGTDVWLAQDQSHYVYQTLTGDGQITARVTSQTATHAWAKAGVMIKETANAGSKYATMAVTPGNGYRFQYYYSGSAAGGAYTFPNAWVRLTRSGNTFTAYTSSNGTSWTQAGSADLAMSAQVTVGFFVTSHNAGALSTVTFDNVEVSTIGSPPAGLPSPWTHRDIGGATPLGSASYESSAFTVDGGGADIWREQDQFQFAYQPLTGDGQITARVTSQTATHAWAKAGVMIKEQPSSNSLYAAMLVTPGNGYRFQYGYNGTTAGGAYTSPNAWVRLARTGQTFAAYTSADGTTWTMVGSADLGMAPGVTIGLFVTSHNAGALSTATFDNVQVTTSVAPPPTPTPTPPPTPIPTPTPTPTPEPLDPPPAPWVHGDVGRPALAGSAGYSDGAFTVKGAGTDIATGQAQFHYVYQTLNGDGRITARITSQTNTNGWAKAGVLMMDVPAPGAVYAATLVTPENGAQFQYYSTSTVAGGVYTFPNAWVRLERSGFTFTAYTSADGWTWTKVGSIAISMGDSITVGLFVASHDTTQLSTVTFDNVQVTTAATAMSNVSSVQAGGNVGHGLYALGTSLTYPGAAGVDGPREAVSWAVPGVVDWTGLTRRDGEALLCACA